MGARHCALLKANPACNCYSPMWACPVAWMAGSWLIERQQSRPRADELRFDAIGITFDAAGRLLELVHLEAAF